MINWQSLVVGVILLAAFLYLGWRGWLRIRSLLTTKRVTLPNCGGCSGCGSSSPLKLKVENSHDSRQFGS